jgi:hypothetical protein
MSFASLDCATHGAVTTMTPFYDLLARFLLARGLRIAANENERENSKSEAKEAKE